MALDLLQVAIHNNYGNTATFDGVISLMPNPSTRFTGRTEVIAKLKSHFFNTNDAVQKRTFFPVIWNGGYWKDSDLLKVY
jgi:hypothetical protein